MKKYIWPGLLFFGIIFPVFLVYKSIFLGNLATWGDAPYFFNGGLSELTKFPSAWTQRTTEFGGVNSLLWISPLMFLAGSLYKFLGLGSDLIVRVLFYFPSIVLSAVSSYAFAKQLKSSGTVQFFTVLVYTLNTYFILLVDGGQVGVALAYGIFPITLLALNKLISLWSIGTFFLTLVVLTLNGIADPRITLIAVVAAVLWNFRNIKGALNLIPLCISWLFLNAFWIFPLLANGGILSQDALDVNVVKLYNPILLFSPHWPDNLFGVVSRPPLYFLGIPALILIGMHSAKKKGEWSLILGYVIFCLLSIFPLGTVFRDSTKFFIPVVLFAGILIGKCLETFKKPIFSVLAFLYLLFLLHPGLLGQMNFVLSGQQDKSDFIKIHDNLKKYDRFFRTLWVPEKHPLAFRTEKNPAVDAKELVKYFPIARLNAGEDPFNFLNSKEFVDVFRVLGIRYVILSGNPREIDKNVDEKKNWDELLSLVDESELKRLDWGTQVQIYEVSDSYPQTFSVEKIVAVVGPGIPAKYPSVYFEDGKLNPRVLKGIDKNSMFIFFNGKKEIDLQMSFLKKYFLFSNDTSSSSWAKYSSSEYLKYKYQLLIRGFVFDDLDYGGGISFSTQNGEEMKFNFEIPKDGSYYIATRTINPNQGEKGFSWKVEKKELVVGVYTHTEKNESDLKVFNAIALIPAKEFEKAESLTKEYLENFITVKNGVLSDFTKYEPFNSESVKENSWIIFTNNYNPGWVLRSQGNISESLPVYSMVNGFFVGDNPTDVSIEFVGQKNLNIGFVISILTFLVLVVLYLIYEKLKK